MPGPLSGLPKGSMSSKGGVHYHCPKKGECRGPQCKANTGKTAKQRAKKGRRR